MNHLLLTTLAGRRRTLGEATFATPVEMPVITPVATTVFVPNSPPARLPLLPLVMVGGAFLAYKKFGFKGLLGVGAGVAWLAGGVWG